MGNLTYPDEHALPPGKTPSGSTTGECSITRDNARYYDIQSCHFIVLLGKTTYYMALVLVYLIRNASRLKRLVSPFSRGKPTFHQCRESITIFSTCGLGLTQSHKFMYPDPPSTHKNGVCPMV